MNILQLVSLALAAFVFLASVLMSTDNPKSMIDIHGILIVIGGTVSASAISFELNRVVMMLKVFWERAIKGGRPDYKGTIVELMKIAEAYRSGGDAKGISEKSKDPFLRECLGLLFDETMDGKQLYKVLYNRVNTMFERYNSEANRFKGMGKYPPAMGLMGAVLGMIALLAGLGKPGAEANMGHAMSVALIATFYGIAFANLVIIPIGENLGEAAKELRTKNTIIVEGLKLISEKTNPLILAEELNSFLLPKERVDYKKLK